MIQTTISWMEENCAPYKWFRDQPDWPAVVIQKARDRFGEDIVVTDERGHGYGTICIQNPKECSSDLCSSLMLRYNPTEDRFSCFLGYPFPSFHWIDTREELKAAVFSNDSDVRMDHAYLKHTVENFSRDMDKYREEREAKEKEPKKTDIERIVDWVHENPEQATRRMRACFKTERYRDGEEDV